MNLGFIGLGAMGKPMAGRLVSTSNQVFVYDVVKSAVEELSGLGAQVCSSPSHVAEKTDITMLSLPNSDIVANVVAGENGILAGARKGHTIIDFSSVDPGTTRRLAEQAEKKGVDYMDAPVSGGVVGAEKGTLTIMLGAKDGSVEKVTPVLELLGNKIFHVGGLGAGDAIKIVNNLILGGNMAVLAEALVLGKKLGLEPDTMAEVIGQSSGGSFVLNAKLRSFIMKGNFKPGFAVDLQYKDLGLASNAAKEMSMPIPMTSQAIQLFEAARAKGCGSEDISSVVKVWESLMGVEVRE